MFTQVTEREIVILSIARHLMLIQMLVIQFERKIFFPCDNTTILRSTINIVIQ